MNEEQTMLADMAGNLFAGLGPAASLEDWGAVAEVEALAPAVVVPGHGRVTDLPGVRADTRDYLQALRTLYDLLIARSDSIGARIGRAGRGAWAGCLR